MRIFAAALLNLALSTAPALAAAPPDSVAADRPVEEPVRQVLSLENFQGLAGLMNLARGSVRILAVVSPTAPGVGADMDAILSILRANSSKRLRVYVVITAAGKGDTAVRAADLAGRHYDKRVVYMWDPTTVVANTWRTPLGIENGNVHSVFFLYDTPATFTDAPAVPDTWMHRRTDLKGPPFDAARLQTRANELVTRVESKAADVPHSH